MEMFLRRKIESSLSTIGELWLGGLKLCDTLEPPMKPCTVVNDPTVPIICIPAGRYQVTLYQSPHFRRMVPLLHNVPGHSFIEIHVGNYPKDTHDCILVGEYLPNSPDMIVNSDSAFEQVVYPKIYEILGVGDLFINVINPAIEAVA